MPDPEGGRFEFRSPSPGLHPLFAGFEDGDFTTMQVENVVDEVIVDIDLTGEITYNAADDVDPSVGQIDVYQGPLPTAGDSDTALRAIMNDTPASVSLTWGFGFPTGAVNFDASNEFELLFLSQSGSQRITSGLQLEDLQVGYEVGFPFSLDIDGPDLLELEWGSADLRVIEAKVGLDNDVSDQSIQGNGSLPGVSGFFSLYDLIASPSDLDGGVSPTAASEFVPLISLMLDDLIEFSVTAALDVELAEINLAFIPLPTFEPELDIEIVFDGSLVFDVWSSTNINETFEIFGVEFGFRNPADYIDNSPFHILPIDEIDLFLWEDVVFGFNGLHGFEDHFDPFV